MRCYAGLSEPQIEMLIEHCEKTEVPVTLKDNCRRVCQFALMKHDFIRPVNKVGPPKSTEISLLGHETLIRALKLMDEHLTRYNAAVEERLAIREQGKLAIAAIHPELYMKTYVDDQNKAKAAVMASRQSGTLAYPTGETVPSEREIA